MDIQELQLESNAKENNSIYESSPNLQSTNDNEQPNKSSLAVESEFFETGDERTTHFFSKCNQF